MTPLTFTLVRLLCAVGMLVVVPVGLRLTGVAVSPALIRTWPWAAGAGAVSMALPRGPVAAILAGTYVLEAVALAAQALVKVRNLALLTALLAPTVAATALTAERAGLRLFGFPLGVLALTVAHFHAAGFGAALVAALASWARPTPSERAAAWSVPAGIAVVLLGFFTNAWVGLVGTAILTAGMWLVAWSTWRVSSTERITRALLVTSGAVLIATMILALDWAAGQALSVPHLNIAWMAATHGVANMLGFALCGVLAWRRLRTEGTLT